MKIPKIPCPVCDGDGKETCNSPDHNPSSRLGCPVCGHDPFHKVPGGGDCEACEGTGEMCHANLTNISKIVNRRLYAKACSIKELVVVLQEKGETLHTSEGEYDDVQMLSHGVMTVLVEFLWKHHNLVVPKRATQWELELVEQYLGGETDDWDWSSDDDDAEARQFERVKWGYSKEVRKKYPDIPVLGNISE